MILQRNINISDMPAPTRSHSIQLAGLGETIGTGNDWLPTGWTVDQVADAVQKGIMAVTAFQVQQINIDRLQRGLQPISTTYASPTVNVGMSPDMQKMLLIGGGILLFVLLAKRR